MIWQTPTRIKCAFGLQTTESNCKMHAKINRRLSFLTSKGEKLKQKKVVPKRAHEVK